MLRKFTRIFSLMLVLCLGLFVAVPDALADDLDRFQPYTDVDLSVFRDANYSAYYDPFNFSAELSMPENESIQKEIDSGILPSNCSLRFDVKILYSAGKVFVIPRIIFGEQGYNN